MTPPERRLRPETSPLFLDWTDVAEPERRTVPKLTNQSLISNSFHLSPPELPTVSTQPFLVPKFFLPIGKIALSPPVKPSPPPATKWEPKDTSQLIRDIALSIESLDLTLSGMDANGGEKGCRYSEVIARKELKSAKCQNQFEKNTKATARLEIRPVEGKDYSEIYKFHVAYDKVPGRTGITVGGFFVSHPLNPGAEGPLDVPQEDPFEEGKDFRKAVRPKFEVPIGKSVANSDKASDLLMRPQGWVYDDFPLATFDITKNTLLARGLTKEKTYRDLGIEPFKFPRRLNQFFDLFSQADACYAKRDDSLVVEPNFLFDKPALIAWAAPEKIDLEIRLRAKTIPLGPYGSLTLGTGNKVRVKGDADKTVIEIEIGDLPAIQLERDAYQLTAKGLKTGKISLTLPPMKEIAKEMGWLERKPAQEIIDSCLGKATNTPVAKDRSAFIKKMFQKIELSEIQAESLEFYHRDRNIRASFKEAKLGKILFKDLKNLEISGIEAKSFSLTASDHDVEAGIQDASIQSLVLNLEAFGPKLAVKKISAPALSLRRGQASLKIDSGEIQALSLDFSQESKMQFALEGLKSKGSVDYKDPSGGPELKTKGRSEVKSFHLDVEKIPAGHDKVKARMKFAGTVDELSFADPKIGNLSLVDTELTEGELSTEVELPKDSTIPLKPIFSLTVSTPKAKITTGHVYFVEIGTSTLEEGKISLENQGQGFSTSLEGKLKLQIQEINIPNVEALLKGLRIEGILKEILITGAGRLKLSPAEVILSKLNASDNTATLNIKGKFEPLRLQDSPSERNDKLKTQVAGKVVNSDMTIKSAQVEVRDLESLHFIKGNKTLGIAPDLRALKVKDFGITQIEAGGKLWAKFPLFGWLMGKFPKIGNFFSQNSGETFGSEIRFDSLDTNHGTEGRTTELKNFSFQLFEVGGRKQMARFKLPLLHISPGKIETGKDPIELEMYFKDKDRGGDFKFELKDEDLSERKRRPAK